MFYVRFDEIEKAKAPNTGISILLTLVNRDQRMATILSYDFELWLLKNEAATESEFISPLQRDLRQDDGGKFQNYQERKIGLLWHFTPRQIQRIQDQRAVGYLLSFDAG